MAKEYAELGFVDGTASGLDNLADLLARLVGGAILLEAKGTKFSTPSDTHLIAERTFDAPRELIWDCWTKPEHITRWMLGPGGWTMPVCEVDLRVGGTWRFVWRNTEGTDMEMTGVYKEIQPYERLVNTENWGADWPETLQILELHDDNGRTRTISTVVYPSKEARDRATETGMLEGWAQSYVTLDGHLADDKTG
ncbi:MAG: SRPBCC family protein [Deltaproteobacteria bacterium]|nr:SRPBCC family protein [bacterium]MCB9487687.1 SRPBCC family protein [Deltaproteobacteria bacterium]